MSGAPVAPGDIIAQRYRVDRVLGQGNMGVVVAATHVQLGQRVAIKFLLADRKVTGEKLERFLREGRAAARLGSRHVTRVLDVGSLPSGAPSTVMELLDGRDLKAVLEERGPLPLAEAVEYVLQAAEALGEAHAAGIVHRDIKPANLFLTLEAGSVPCVKIFDFGISKVSGDLALTSTEQSIGSPLYMSPEQLNSSRDVDPRADLWSLGVTLYQLLAGKTPFHAEKVEQLMMRIFTDAPTPLTALRPDAPWALWAAIARCLEKDREQRWPNVAAFAAAIAPWAPARAASYPERVARILGVPFAPAADGAPPSPLAAPGPHAASPSQLAASQSQLASQSQMAASQSQMAVAMTAASGTQGSASAPPAPAAAPLPPRRGSARWAVAGAIVFIALPAGGFATYGLMGARQEPSAAPEPSPALTAPAPPPATATPSIVPSAPAVTTAPPPSVSASSRVPPRAVNTPSPAARPTGKPGPRAPAIW